MESDRQTTLAEEDSDSSPVPPFHVGDHVTDRENDEEKPMLVAGIPGATAREYEFQPGKSIADVNEAYPETDEAIEVVFPSRTNSDIDEPARYAYPASRLKMRNPIHPTEESEEENDAR